MTLKLDFIKVSRKLDTDNRPVSKAMKQLIYGKIGQLSSYLGKNLPIMEPHNFRY